VYGKCPHTAQKRNKEIIPIELFCEMVAEGICSDAAQRYSGMGQEDFCRQTYQK
jgi:hypothetical protein